MSYDPETTALVVVDMQNGFCHPDGSLYAPGSQAAIEPVGKLIDRARGAETPVIYTRDVHPPQQFEDAHYYDEFDRWGEHVLEGTWEAEIVDELPVADEDHVIVKHTYDAFYQTELEGWLAAHNIDTLLFCGTLANVCVFHSAASAGLRDFKPVLVEDALGYLKDEHLEYAVGHTEFLFGETTTLEALDLEANI